MKGPLYATTSITRADWVASEYRPRCAAAGPLQLSLGAVRGSWDAEVSAVRGGNGGPPATRAMSPFAQRCRSAVCVRRTTANISPGTCLVSVCPFISPVNVNSEAVFNGTVWKRDETRTIALIE